MHDWVDRWLARLLRTRGVVRAPVALYRMRLGWVLGPRLVMLEHRGRITGLRRFVVLESWTNPSDTGGSWSQGLLIDRNGCATSATIRTAGCGR